MRAPTASAMSNPAPIPECAPRMNMRSARGPMKRRRSARFVWKPPSASRTDLPRTMLPSSSTTPSTRPVASWESEAAVADSRTSPPAPRIAAWSVRRACWGPRSGHRCGSLMSRRGSRIESGASRFSVIGASLDWKRPPAPVNHAWAVGAVDTIASTSGRRACPQPRPSTRSRSTPGSDSRCREVRCTPPPDRAVLPPALASGADSSSTTSRPSWAARAAAALPASPAPTTMTRSLPD